ncbi:hypothetical protein [Bdellovibrio bacteriovorus]|uniref:hypothetical protein n=1 Tax=Bdellovibrio bacteriovorus TaxID=959 RepID=UPI001E2FEB1B|nr:hypothetical protein [Bdellovibrio bacteriovorus]
MATAAFQKILENLSGNKNVQNLLESFQKLSDEIKKKESELKGRFDQEKEDKIEPAKPAATTKKKATVKKAAAKKTTKKVSKKK